MSRDLAILCGDGQLPLLLQNELPEALCVVFEGMPHQLAEGSFTKAKFEKLGGLFDVLKDKGIVRILMVGSMSRPSLNIVEFDPFMKSIGPTLSGMMSEGDDHLLRFVIGLFHAQGFQIVGAIDVLPELVAQPGAIVTGWTDRYLNDLRKADKILSALAEADVAQAVVVEGGMVLGIETLQGTDALLDFVQKTDRKLRNRDQKGILVKRPKLGQDLRVDIPSIGPKTIEQVAKAGLAGIIISPKAVLLIERDRLIELAQRLGVFIHALEHDE
ncbi:MAG: LpxI family protein [Paracoccaceae bacterium]|nr:LpxI family protein [Paracoccaceae bacterium]